MRRCPASAGLPGAQGRQHDGGMLAGVPEARAGNGARRVSYGHAVQPIAPRAASGPGLGYPGQHPPILLPSLRPREPS